MKHKKCPRCGSDLAVTKSKTVSIKRFYLFDKIKVDIPQEVKISKEKICYSCGYYEPRCEDEEINLLYEQILKERIKRYKDDV